MSRKVYKKKSKPVVKDDYSDIFDDSEPPPQFEIPITKKRPIQQQTEMQNEDLEKMHEQANQIRCPIETINIEQTLHDILYESSKESTFSKTLKQLLSQGQRELKDKLKYFQFKWQSLGHLNCSRSEYQRQEQLLKDSQQNEMREIQQQILQNLSEKKIPGFQSKDDILNEFRGNFMKKRHFLSDGPAVEEFQFYVEPAEAQKLQKDQLLLLEKLLEEQHLVSEVPELRKYHSAPEVFKRDITEQRLQLCPLISMDKIIKEKFLNLNSYQITELMKLQDQEVHLIPKNVRVMMLDSKSDEIYTDKQFQLEQASKYVEVFNQLKQQHYSELNLDKLLELTIYIVNNAHYQQKFQLADDKEQVSPKDLLQLLDRLYKM